MSICLFVLSLLQGFVVQLVCDLLDEGNAAFREGEWTQARGHFSEGVNVSLYAKAEALHVPDALLESLYINRAAAHQNMVSVPVFADKTVNLTWVQSWNIG